MHKLVHGDFWIVYHRARAVYNFGKVVRRYVRGKTYRYARRAVNKQVGKPPRKRCGFFERIVKVEIPVDRVFIYITQKLESKRLKLDLGITHCSRAVAVHRTEVTMSRYKRFAHVERLRKSDHGIVYRRVAVRMIFCKTVADYSRTFLVIFIGEHALIVHRIQNTALNGLKSVLHPRQRSVEYYVFGIGEHAVMQYRFQRVGYYPRLILFVFHSNSSKFSTYFARFSALPFGLVGYGRANARRLFNRDLVLRFAV